MMDKQKIYPRSKDQETVYLKNVITDPSIIVGDYTMYNDFVNDPVDFQKNNVHYFLFGVQYWIPLRTWKFILLGNFIKKGGVDYDPKKMVSDIKRSTAYLQAA